MIHTAVGANSFIQSTGKLFAVIGCDNVRYTSFADHMFENIRACSGESMSFLQWRQVAISVKWSTITKVPVYLNALDPAKSVTKSTVSPSQG